MWVQRTGIATAGITVPCFLLIQGPALALDGPPGGLSTYESKYYIVDTDLPADRAKDIGREMDAAGKEYDRRFAGFSRKIQHKLRLKVYSTKERYVDELKRITYGGKNQFTNGRYNPTDETVYTFDGPQLEDVLKHECFHQFAHGVVGGSLPTWVNEGLAAYFEDGAFDDKTGQMRLGEIRPDRVKLLKAAAEGKALASVEQIMKITGSEWMDNMDTPRGSLQYAQAWALCHFLVHGDDGQYQTLFDAYLHEVDKGLDGDTAFKRVFGEDLKPLQTKYDAYVAHLIAVTPLDEPDKSEDKEHGKPKSKDRSP